MAVRRTSTQSYLAMIEKFNKIEMSMAEGAETIRTEIAKDLKELTEGANPSGKARKKWLARTGHPYGRGQSAGESTPTGRKRGIHKDIRRKERAKTGRTSAPTLPIGEISGGLIRSRFVTKAQKLRQYRITAGFNRSAGGALFVVIPSGTKKMVGRGLWGKNEGGELGKRVKMYRKAFRDKFIKLNFLP